MYYPGQTIRVKFFVKQTGLSQGSFTTQLQQDGVNAGSLTITEDAIGWYNAFFTPASGGKWTLRIDYNEFHLSGEWSVQNHILNEVVASFQNAGSVGKYTKDSRHYARNRLVISGGNYTLYEDDDTTPYEVGTVSTTERNPT